MNRIHFSHIGLYGIYVLLLEGALICKECRVVVSRLLLKTFNCLYCLLCLPIALGVVWTTCNVFESILLTKLCIRFGWELRTIVTHNNFRYPMACKHWRNIKHHFICGQFRLSRDLSLPRKVVHYKQVCGLVPLKQISSPLEVVASWKVKWFWSLHSVLRQSWQVFMMCLDNPGHHIECFADTL